MLQECIGKESDEIWTISMSNLGTISDDIGATQGYGKIFNVIRTMCDDTRKSDDTHEKYLMIPTRFQTISVRDSTLLKYI